MKKKVSLKLKAKRFKIEIRFNFNQLSKMLSDRLQYVRK